MTRLRYYIATSKDKGFQNPLNVYKNNLCLLDASTISGDLNHGTNPEFSQNAQFDCKLPQSISGYSPIPHSEDEIVLEPIAYGLNSIHKDKDKIYQMTPCSTFLSGRYCIA